MSDVLPCLIEPDASAADLPGLLRRRRATLVERLHAHGALLFRGFALQSDEDVEQCARAFSADLLTDYGDLPHARPQDAVYAATPYPPTRRILFHNEGSHTERWPATQYFFCSQPARTGGATPLVDGRRVYEALPRPLIETFERKGLRYVRNFIPSLDVSWQSYFNTTDRQAVEAVCAAGGTMCEWLGGDRLRTTARRVATLRHEPTGAPVFFNQILLHHPAALDPVIRDGLLTVYGEDGLPRNVTYGDGTPIDAPTIAAVLDVYDALAASFAWARGDLLIVDNVLVSHGRDPYTGERRIRVVMGDPMTSRFGEAA